MAPSVLIVDDYGGFRAVARTLLQQLGYVVYEACDGASAIAAAAATRPDLVLLDVALPDIDGFDVERALSAEGCRSRVVMISSRPAAAYAARLQTSGAIGFIPKSELTAEAVSHLVGAP